MKKVSCILSCVMVFCLMFALCSCAQNNTTESTINVTLKADYPVEVGGVKINKLPEKVVSLSPAITEIIYTLGNNSQLCAVSNGCDYPDIPKSMTRVGTVVSLKIDDIVKMQPDVVFTASELEDTDKMMLENAKITIVDVKIPTEFSEALQAYNTVSMVLSGKSTGPENAQNTLDNLKSSVQAVKESYNVNTKTVLVCLDYDKQGSAGAYSGSAGGFVLDSIGAVNALGTATDFAFSDEDIISSNPDYIFCKTGDESIILENEKLSGVTAVQKMQVYGINVAPFERMSDRLKNSAIEICDKIYTKKAV